MQFLTIWWRGRIAKKLPHAVVVSSFVSDKGGVELMLACLAGRLYQGDQPVSKRRQGSAGCTDQSRLCLALLHLIKKQCVGVQALLWSHWPAHVEAAPKLACSTGSAFQPLICA
eukprot:1142260-Pelagomonas_calceolata.AAC.3